jgi:hypothetical protein
LSGVIGRGNLRISAVGGLHLSGADEQALQDAVFVAVDRPKILWLLRLNGDPEVR